MAKYFILMRTVVGFLSRPHGFNVLSALVESDEFRVIKLYTHRLNPKSQDLARSQREDFSLFQAVCEKNDLPLVSIDSKSDKIEQVPECDFIVEVSWRYMIPQEIVKKARIGVFGIHRGKLPDYAGAEPIKQALLNNENEIVLSAHYLASEIDSGNTITTISHPVNFDPHVTLEDNVQRLRDEITPLFSKLTFQTFNIFGRKDN